MLVRQTAPRHFGISHFQGVAQIQRREEDVALFIAIPIIVEAILQRG
jgi:hypothetical protein